MSAKCHKRTSSLLQCQVVTFPQVDLAADDGHRLRASRVVMSL